MSFNLSSREWNEKWFTSADAWKIEKSENNTSTTTETVDDSDIPVLKIIRLKRTTYLSKNVIR